MKRAILVLAFGGILLPAALPAVLPAQTWRVLRVENSIDSTAVLTVQIAFGEGALDVRSSPERFRYSAQLRYDADRSLPRHTLDREKHTLSLGAEKLTERFSWKGGQLSEAKLELPTGIPLDATVNLGAATAVLNLGGLSLQRLQISGGASQSRLRFDEVNPVRMSELILDGSAGTMRVTGIGNTRAEVVQAQVHLGSLELDFSGEWSGDITADIKVVLGSAELTIPPDVGVEVRSSRVLSSIEAAGLVQEGDRYVSQNFDSAERKLRITVHTVLGSVSIQRPGRTR